MSAKSAGEKSIVRRVAGAIASAGRIVVTTHVHMDGDALGSAAALCLLARSAGKECRLAFADAVPERYAFVLGGLAAAGAKDFAALAREADVVVVVDTCAFAQLEPLAEALREVREKVVVIDHHATADDVGAIVWRDPSAAAAGVLLAELAAELGWRADAPAATALAAAILTDTGWLRHSNTDARCLRVLADLLAAGADANEIYRCIYQNDRPERLRLLATALSSLQMHAGDRVAVMSLTRDDLARAGAVDDEVEDFVNEPLRIGSLEVSVLVVELADGRTRASLRSRGGVDVARLAGLFGGGGHARAAGLKSDDDLPTLRTRLLAACVAAMGRRA